MKHNEDTFKEVMELAHWMADDWGESADTVKSIALIMNISAVEVQDILQSVEEQVYFGAMDDWDYSREYA